MRECARPRTPLFRVVVAAALAWRCVLAVPAAGSSEHDPAAQPHAGDGEHAGERRVFTVEDFERAGVRVRTAGPGDVDAALEFPAEVRPNGDRLAHVAPRYSGIVREVRKYVGDSVRAGDVLALVESDSLSTFEVRAAFDGTVIEKHLTPGEAVGRDRSVFVIADLSSVWVDVSIPLSALPVVRVALAVGIRAAHAGLESAGTISYVTPVVDPTTRTATARVVLPNADGRWRPGTFATATILSPVAVAVAIPHDAVQRIDERPTVFVVAGDRFEARLIAIGRAGRSTVEVVSGIRPGERYAAERSFLVKAELTKGEAGHHD